MKRSIMTAFVAALCCAGCVQSIQTNITVFHTLPPMQSGKTVIISSADTARDSTLEFRSYAEKLAGHFEMVGYRVVQRGPDTAPDYVVVFNYGIDDGRDVTTSSSRPIYGDKDDPDRITGYQTRTNSATAYRGVVTLDMYNFATYRANQNLDQSQVYSARLISNGYCASLAGAIDEMLSELFNDFPGESGRPRDVVLSLEGDSC